MEFFFNTSHKLAQFCIHLYFEWMIFEIMQSVYIYIPDRLHNIAFLEHIKSALQNVLIKIRFKGIKKTTHFQFFLKMNGLSRFFYSVEWWKYYFAFDVFPKPQSNTTETFTPSEIAFFMFFGHSGQTWKTSQSAGSRKVLQTSRLAGSRRIPHKHWLYSQLFLRNSPRCLRANQGFLHIDPM